ncbi:MAG: ribbon-helix-helix domain-containing protein [Promethearchaeota archaeon]
MPIMSFSISESLRKFLRKLVKGGSYKNNSNVMRAALSQLMEAYAETGEIMLSPAEMIPKSVQKVMGNVMIIIDKYDENVEKKLAKIETEFKQSINAKNCFFSNKINKTIVYVIEDIVENLQRFITKLNQIEKLKNIRYIIL